MWLTPPAIVQEVHAQEVINQEDAEKSGNNQEALQLLQKAKEVKGYYDQLVELMVADSVEDLEPEINRFVDNLGLNEAEKQVTEKLPSREEMRDFLERADQYGEDVISPTQQYHRDLKKMEDGMDWSWILKVVGVFSIFGVIYLGYNWFTRDRELGDDDDDYWNQFR